MAVCFVFFIFILEGGEGGLLCFGLSVMLLYEGVGGFERGSVFGFVLVFDCEFCRVRV